MSSLGGYPYWEYTRSSYNPFPYTLCNIPAYPSYCLICNKEKVLYQILDNAGYVPGYVCSEKCFNLFVFRKI
jgi:hypothetical protein